MTLAQEYIHFLNCTPETWEIENVEFIGSLLTSIHELEITAKSVKRRSLDDLSQGQRAPPLFSTRHEILYKVYMGFDSCCGF
jgi:hypothetical protein